MRVGGGGLPDYADAPAGPVTRNSAAKLTQIGPRELLFNRREKLDGGCDVCRNDREAFCLGIAGTCYLPKRLFKPGRRHSVGGNFTVSPTVKEESGDENCLGAC